MAAISHIHGRPLLEQERKKLEQVLRDRPASCDAGVYAKFMQLRTARLDASGNITEEAASTLSPVYDLVRASMSADPGAAAMLPAIAMGSEIVLFGALGRSFADARADYRRAVFYGAQYFRARNIHEKASALMRLGIEPEDIENRPDPAYDSSAACNGRREELRYHVFSTISSLQQIFTEFRNQYEHINNRLQVNEINPATEEDRQAYEEQARFLRRHVMRPIRNAFHEFFTADFIDDERDIHDLEQSLVNRLERLENRLEAIGLNAAEKLGEAEIGYKYKLARLMPRSELHRRSLSRKHKQALEGLSEEDEGYDDSLYRVVQSFDRQRDDSMLFLKNLTGGIEQVMYKLRDYKKHYNAQYGLTPRPESHTRTLMARAREAGAKLRDVGVAAIANSTAPFHIFGPNRFHFYRKLANIVSDVRFLARDVSLDRYITIAQENADVATLQKLSDIENVLRRNDKIARKTITLYNSHTKQQDPDGKHEYRRLARDLNAGINELSSQIHEGRSMRRSLKSNLVSTVFGSSFTIATLAQMQNTAQSLQSVFNTLNNTGWDIARTFDYSANSGDLAQAASFGLGWVAVCASVGPIRNFTGAMGRLITRNLDERYMQIRAETTAETQNLATTLAGMIERAKSELGEELDFDTGKAGAAPETADQTREESTALSALSPGLLCGAGRPNARDRARLQKIAQARFEGYERDSQIEYEIAQRTAERRRDFAQRIKPQAA